MRVDAISIGNHPPEDINVIIEVPLGGQPIKYELDKEAGVLVVDHFLYTPMSYPGNYGFVPHTLSEDGVSANQLLSSCSWLIVGQQWSDPYFLIDGQVCWGCGGDEVSGAQLFKGFLNCPAGVAC